MRGHFDITNEAIHQNLAETISWCAGQQLLPGIEETGEMRRRQAAVRQANELMRRAMREGNRFWNKLFRRDYTKSELWRRAAEQYRQIDLGPLAPLEAQLRTPALRPDPIPGEIPTRKEWNEYVGDVVARRSRLVNPIEQPIDPAVGRLLIYVPEENVADGAAQYASNGFFDVYNVPPWDTWVSFREGALLNWVPTEVMKLAQHGIDVDPVCSIRWME